MIKQLTKVEIQSISRIGIKKQLMFETYSFDTIGWKYNEYVTGLTIWI